MTIHNVPDTTSAGSSTEPRDLVFRNTATLREIGLALARASWQRFRYDAILFSNYEARNNALVPIYGEDLMGASEVPVESDLDEMVRLNLHPEPRLTNRDKESEDVNLVPFGDEHRRSMSIMYVPLLFGGEIVGCVSVQSYTPYKYDLNDLEELVEICRDIPGAVVNARYREQSTKLSRAIEQSSSMVLITDYRGRIEYANPKLLEVSGYSLEELWGKNPRLFKSGDITREEYDHLWKQISSGHSWSGQFRNRKKNGEFYWVLATVSPIQDEMGTITHFLSVQEDISEKRAAEERLRTHHAVMRAVAFAAERFLSGKDLEGDLARFVEQLGEATLAQKVHVCQNTPNGEPNALLMRACWISSGRPGGKDPTSYAEQGLGDCLERLTAGDTCVLPDPSCGTGRKHGSRVILPIISGGSLWGILALEDIQRDRPVLAEDLEGLRAAASVLGAAFNRLATEDALRQSERTSRTLLNSSPMLCALLEIDGTIVDINTELAADLGFARKELIGHKAYDKLPDEVALTRRAAVEEVVRTGRAALLEDEHNGKIYVSNIIPVTDSQKKVLRVAIFAQDVTQTRRNERLAAVGLSASGVAHYIKNIQTTLRGSIKLVDYGFSLKNEAIVAEGWPIVKRSASRLNQLMKNMLALARGGLSFEENIDVNKLLQECVEECRILSQSIGLDIDVSLDEQLPSIVANSSRLHDALLNLLSNAIEAVERLEDRRPQVTVSTNSTARPGYIQIRIGDNGIGISEENRGHVLDPFFTTKGDRGTGLGLAVVVRVVDEHGGHLIIDSEVEQGTEFRIDLPLDPRATRRGS